MHQKILSRIGADKVVFPEKESGTRLAKNLISSGFVDIIELSKDISMVELNVRPEWVSKTLVELNLRKKYSINVVAIKMNDEVNMDIDPHTVLTDAMKLIVVANVSKLDKCK
jgi:trk system potassium uptake protein TrkA